MRQIFTNGNIYTMDSEARPKSRPKSVIVENGRISEIIHGKENSLGLTRDAGIFDLKGCTLIPGFIDSHNHMLTAGLNRFQLDLKDKHYRDIHQLLESVAAYAKKNPQLDWIRCIGFDESCLENSGIKQMPTPYEIDAVLPDRPVILTRVCGHVSVLNSRALDILDLSNEEILKYPGQFEKKEGKLTGCVREDARQLVLNRIPGYSTKEIVAAIDNAQKELLIKRICGIHEPGTDQVTVPEYLEGYRQAQDTGVLKIRTYLMGRESGGSIRQTMATIKKWQHQYMIQKTRLFFGGMKFFADGSIGGKTAAVNAPYKGTQNRGLLLDDALKENIRLARENKFQVCVHAIGDRAIEWCLNLFEESDQTDSPKNQYRIEHCEVCTKKILNQIEKTRTSVCLQPGFLYEFGDTYINFLGRERADALLPIQSFLDRNILFSFSADYPVIDCDPLTGITHSLTRTTKMGTPLNPDERIKIHDVLKAYTIDAARMSDTESYQGTLGVGKYADFTILNKDIFKTDITDIKVMATVINGELVYAADEFSGSPSAVS